MRIYPATHYTMGGLWVDYNLMSTIPGLFVLGEANFSDHGANRLGASALMQGLADGYFIAPYTVGNYLASTKLEKVSDRPPGVPGAEAWVADRTKTLLGIRGGRTVDTFHRELGKIMWDYCGMARTERGAQDGAREDPGPARGVLEGRPRAGRRRGDQPVAREGRPRGRLPRAGRADVPRRPGAPRVVRRPLPRGVPDRGRRGPARRRELLPRGRLGIHRRGQRPRSATSSRWSSRTSPCRPGVTSDRRRARLRPSREATATGTHDGRTRERDDAQPDAPRLAPDEPPGPGRVRDLRGPRHQPGHVVPRDARRRERGAHPQGRGADRLRPRLPRGDLRPVRGRRSTASRTGRAGPRRRASSTCGASTTATS